VGGRWSVNASQLRSVKRALRRLEAEGKVAAESVSYDRQRRWQFVKKPRKNPDIVTLERENAKLRELLREAYRPAVAEI
jgi:hypothetical protein